MYQDCILLMYTHTQRHAVGFESSFYLYDGGENLHSLISVISRSNANHFLLPFSIRGHENWKQTSILNFGHPSDPFILFHRTATTFIIKFHFYYLFSPIFFFYHSGCLLQLYISVSKNIFCHSKNLIYCLTMYFNIHSSLFSKLWGRQVWLHHHKYCFGWESMWFRRFWEFLSTQANLFRHHPQNHTVV